MFAKLRTWTRGSQRAVHKPLLILYAFGQLQLGREKLPYKDIDQPFKKLLKNFGPNSKSYHSEYPFWRLQNDGIWELTNAEKVEARKSNTDAKKSELLKYRVNGGYNPKILRILKSKPELLYKIAKELLSAHFPETWHEEIMGAVGLQFNYGQYDAVKEKRDPKFRSKVLIAYQYKCAVCGSSLQIGDHWPTLEAAHIKWHQANGPDIESNGLGLCSTHHKLFDRGAFTINDRNQIIASEEIHGNGLEEVVLRYHSKLLNDPIRKSYVPELKYKNWHRHEVFRGKGREI